MKSNLKSKRNTPAVAYLCQTHLVLSVFHDGEFHLIQKDLALNPEINSLDSDFLVDLKLPLKSKLIIILSPDLVLYSQQKLPLNLSKQEIAELIAIHLSQRQQDSQIATYYDYFSLKQSEASAIFGLFEARKDTLDLIIEKLKYYGFKVSLIIPQILVAINQIIRNNNLQQQNHHIACRLDNQIFIAQVINHQLFELQQIHLSTNQPGSSMFAEIRAQFDEMNVQLAIIFGLDILKLKQHFTDTNIKVIEFESLTTQDHVIPISINWMREQNDFYKSIALA